MILFLFLLISFCVALGIAISHFIAQGLFPSKYLTLNFSAYSLAPGENLEEVSVQIIISGDEIAGFRFELDSLELDNQDNEQFLYQYVVRTYGPIEGAERKNWTGHKIWQIFDQEVLYSKSFFLKKLEEELIVTNSKHRDAFVNHDPDLDEPQEEQ